jgi:hypothetical protein
VSDPGKVRKLFRLLIALRFLGPVLVPVLLACDASQVADVIVGRVAVNVVDVHVRRDRPIVVLPYFAVKSVASPRKVFAVRWIAAFRIPVVFVAVKDDRLDNSAA